MGVGRCHHNEQWRNGREKGKKRNSSCAVVRGRTEEMRVISGPELQPRAMSGSLVLQQPESVLTHQRPQGCLGPGLPTAAMLASKGCAATRARLI